MHQNQRKYGILDALTGKSVFAPFYANAGALFNFSPGRELNFSTQFYAARAENRFSCFWQHCFQTGKNPPRHCDKTPILTWFLELPIQMLLLQIFEFLFPCFFTIPCNLLPLFDVCGIPFPSFPATKTFPTEKAALGLCKSQSQHFVNILKLSSTSFLTMFLLQILTIKIWHWSQFWSSDARKISTRLTFSGFFAWMCKLCNNPRFKFAKCLVFFFRFQQVHFFAQMWRQPSSG